MDRPVAVHDLHCSGQGLNWFLWGLGALLFPLLAFLAVLGMPDRKQRLLIRLMGEQLQSIKQTGVRLHERSSRPKFSRPAAENAVLEQTLSS